MTSESSEISIYAAWTDKENVCREEAFTVPSPCTALAAAKLAARHFGFELPRHFGLAVWSKRTEPETLLKEGDRVDITRELLISPNDARKLRAERASEYRDPRQGRHGGTHRLI